MTTKLAKAKSKAMNYRAEYRKLKEKHDELQKNYDEILRKVVTGMVVSEYDTVSGKTVEKIYPYNNRW